MSVDSTAAPRAGDPPFISVVVPCRNEEQWVAACLESILANDYPPERMEVLLVDGMSDDATRQIAEAFWPPGTPGADRRQRQADHARRR